MKLKAVITESAPQDLIKAFGGRLFAISFIGDIVTAIFHVRSPVGKPAEYYVQKPDLSIDTGYCGIIVNLTGVSRGRRKPKQFHDALKKLHEISKRRIETLLDTNQTAQLFCTIMLDKEISIRPGEYSNILESKAEWVCGKKTIE